MRTDLETQWELLEEEAVDVLRGYHVRGFVADAHGGTYLLTRRET